jgi:hypothetical protein
MGKGINYQRCWRQGRKSGEDFSRVNHRCGFSFADMGTRVKDFCNVVTLRDCFSMETNEAQVEFGAE